MLLKFSISCIETGYKAVTNILRVFYHGATAPSGPWPPQNRRFTIILRHITVIKTPLDEWSARRRDLYL